MALASSLGIQGGNPLSLKKVLALTKYGDLGASSRMRFLQYLPYLQKCGVEVTTKPLLSNDMLRERYQNGGYGKWQLFNAYAKRTGSILKGRQFDIIWIEKEALPWLPAWFELLLLRGKFYVLDFDDAIFHNYDLHRSAWARYIYGRRIDRLMRRAQLVVTGNNYLTDRATAAGAKNVVEIPTVVDLARYPAKENYALLDKPCIVWIGSPSTAQYLIDLAEPLGALAQRHPFTLRVIGAGAVTLPGVDVEVVAWSADTEAAEIAKGDIGIMPLRNTPWELGKCAYKLIQYMACGLPAVASPIGANREVVLDGETGYFADTAAMWIEKIELLLRNVTLRQRFGQSGRARVEAYYCLQQTAPKVIRMLADTAEK